jgi:translation initiation factor IF-3
LEECPIKGGKSNSKKALINEEIESSEVRLVGAGGEQVGIVPIQQARDAASEAGLDLVLMADSNPPVCKVMDYGKHVFDAKKQQAAARKKTETGSVKRDQVSPRDG